MQTMVAFILLHDVYHNGCSGGVIIEMFMLIFMQRCYT